MFLINKYSKWYHNIINHAKTRPSPQYKERHHIIPKSLGGSNDKINLVDLTPREHYICHLLLTKFTTGEARKKMFYALHRLTNLPTLKIKSSKIYEYLKRNRASYLSATYKGKSYLESFGKEYAHEISDFQKQQISKSNSERIWTEEMRKKMSISKSKPNPKLKSHKKSQEHKDNLSKSRRERFKKSCKPFIWIHEIYGTFYGTIIDLKEHYPGLDIRINEITKVLTGMYKSHRGWKLAETDI